LGHPRLLDSLSLLGAAAAAAAAVIEAKLLSSTASFGLLESNFQRSRDREAQLGVLFFLVGSLESILSSLF